MGWLTRRVKNALRTASTLFWALVTLAILALIAANLVQLASRLSHLPGMIYDPVRYLEDTSYIPVTQDTQIDVYTTGTLTVVLTEDGESYLFTRPKETSKTWSYRYFGSTEWEGMYYIPAGGLYPDHVVMVADDGTVYEPVYEAHFENGYAPIFAFDVSQEQEYHGLVVCRDENGVYHYDCTAVTYTGLADWENIPESDYRRDDCTSFNTLGNTTESQSAFIAAYNSWKSTVYDTDPADCTVTEDNYFLDVTYTYPPTLSVMRSYSVKGVFTGYEGGTGGNTLVQRVYDYHNGQAVFYWNQRFSSGLWSLIQADDLTLEQVQAATRSSGAGRTPQNVVTYAVTVPDSLIDLWQEAIS
jgi:hypothetical protein